MKRLGLALALLAALGGCGVLKKGAEKHKTAVLGERIPVLTAESGAEVDPSLADTPVTVPDAAVNDKWAQPGGNAAKSMGHVALGEHLARAWSVSIGGGSKKERLAAAPVIADGKLFAMDTGGIVHAFDAATGARLWTRQVEAKDKGKHQKKARSSLFGGGVSWDEGRLYATNGLGDAAALDAATGNIIWQKRPGGPLRGSPTVANGSVYVVSQDNQLFALKAETGETLWNEAGTLELAGVFGVAAPAVGQGTVVAGFSSGELNAYRYENGRIVWQDALSRTSISTSVSSLSDIDADPVIDAGRVYAVGQGGRMVALELVTGQRQWELNVAGIATPWVAGDWVFVVTDEARLLCIARGTGKIRWIAQLRHYHKDKSSERVVSWVGPILAGGRLILASSEGDIANVSVTDGKIQSTTKVGAPVNLAPVVANSTLYVLDTRGQIIAWK